MARGRGAGVELGGGLGAEDRLRVDEAGDRDRVLARPVGPQASRGDLGRRPEARVEDDVDVGARQDRVDVGRDRRVEPNVEAARLAEVEALLGRRVHDPAAEHEPRPRQPGLDDDPAGVPGRPDRRPDPVHAHLQRGPEVWTGRSHRTRVTRPLGRRYALEVAPRSDGRHDGLDAIVVGAGPNGLAAAITLARAGRSVRVYEAAATAGGGTRTEELTLPGFRHDVCSTILPLTLASPFFADDRPRRPRRRARPPGRPGRASARRRAGGGPRALGGGDRGRARRGGWAGLAAAVRAARPRRRASSAAEILRPVVHVPRHPLALARFGLPALRSARGLARARFDEEPARALFAGIAAHSMLRLDRPLSASFGLVLGDLRPRGRLADGPRRGGRRRGALVAELEAAGGEVVTGHRVGSLADLPPARAVLLDVTPRQLVAIAGDRLPPGAADAPSGSATARACSRWTGRSTGRSRGPPTAPRRAATVHLGGTLDEIAAAEADVAAGRHPDRPFVLFVQYAPWDPTRAPAGKTTAWAYCHVPAGSTVDMTDRIEAQVERFAPGLPRPDPRPRDARAGGDGGVQRELRRRRHQRRDRGHPAAVLPAVAVARPVSRRRRALPVLVVDAARRRRPRDGGMLAARSALGRELR